ncbi:MAG: hypothetical protein GX802_06630, partial [Clostridiales bacterium]|nr:hypothetical protein [Clostridiales bacterium]
SKKNDTADTGLKINQPHSSADSSEPTETDEIEDEESRIKDAENDINETTKPYSTTGSSPQVTESTIPSTAEPTEAPTLPENEFTALMPEVRLDLMWAKDNEYGTTAVYAPITRGDFNSLGRIARDSGFEIDVLVVDMMFSASNADGMHIKIEVTKEATKITVYNDVKHFS